MIRILSIIIFIVLVTLFFTPLVTFAAPFVVSDPAKNADTGQITNDVTHCGLLFDSDPIKDVPVIEAQGGKICKFDMSGIPTGIHTVKAIFVNNDPVWGRVESAVSVPFTFIKPNAPMAPSGMVVQP